MSFCQVVLNLYIFLVEVKREVPVFRTNYNSLYIQHLKYILFCCTLVSKCIQVGFNEIQKENLMVFGVLFIFSFFLPANLFSYLKSSRYSS